MQLPSFWSCEDAWLRSSAQAFLRFLGFVFWATAAAQAFGGVLVILMFKNYRYLFQESYLYLPGWLAVAAALILLPTGILAVSISLKSSRNQQGIFMYLLLLLLCLETSSAVLAHVYSTRTASQLESAMGYLVYQHNGSCSQPGSRAVDVMQRELQCCGVRNYTDWLKATAASWHLTACVPESCCNEKYSHCRGHLNHLEQISQQGCLKKLEDQLWFVMLYVFWCCTLLSVLELLAAVSNGILMRHQPFHDIQFLDKYSLSWD